jgi:HPt (histidine-containing phosphotransfer) domain-containing protein
MSLSPPAAAGRPVALVDRDLADLVPGFLERRGEDLRALRSALARQEFVELAALAHTLKGTCGGYGFHGLTELSGLLEAAARAADGGRSRALVEAFANYLEQVEVVLV